MDLETLVRPFTTPNPLGTRRITTVRTKVPTETSGGTWGVAGNLPVAVEVPPGEDPLSIGIATQKKTNHIEISRETEKVRVENPEDPNQYVIVERIKNIGFKDKNPDTLAAFKKTGSVTQTTPGASPSDQWQPGETQISTDGVDVARDLADLRQIDYLEAYYELNWPPGGSTAPEEP